MRRGRPKHNDVLTPREWQVLNLIREGLTNEGIGGRLSISLSAVKYHVSEIFSKVGVSSRIEAIQFLDDYERNRRPLPGLAWLFHKSSSNTAPPVASLGAASVVVAGILVLIPFLAAAFSGLLLSDSSGQAGPSQSQSDLGPDVGAEGQGLSDRNQLSPDFARTLLLSKATPSNVAGEAETVRALRRVSSIAELEAALHQDINLVVVDQSSLEDLKGSDILHRQLREGRSLMGLNISNTELREVSDYARLVNERRTDRDGPPLPEIRGPSMPERGFYSVLLYRMEGGALFIGGDQKYFFEDLFKEELSKLDQDAWREEEPPALRIADLPEERIHINKGMGCTYNEAKTAAVAKKELAARHPEAEASAVMIVYCNPGPAGTVILGALLPRKQEPFSYTPPPGCVDASGRPSSEPRCLPPPRTGAGTDSAGALVRIEVPISDVTP